MVEVLIIPHKDASETLGTFITCKDYADRIIDYDCDLYAMDPLDPTKADEDNIIFKYRKNVFTKEECDMAYAGLRAAATESQNRGIAAGPRGDQLGQEGRGNRDWVTAEQLELLEYLMVPENAKSLDDRTIESIRKRHKTNIAKDETRGQVWLRSEVTKVYPEYHGWFGKWIAGLHNMSVAEQITEAHRVHDTYISETNYAQSVMSGIAGFYDRYPRIPFGRATAYTEKNPEEFALAFPYLRKLNQQFKELLPVRWGKQRAAADKLDPRFLVDETVFTTLTVNHNWRTACHYDAGDLHEGFSNICGITGPEGKGWKGAEFILPEFRTAINLQPGDMLLVNNHGGIHGNDALLGDDNDRLTLVSYFREKMLELKSWEYESLRKQYIEERRHNKEHPLQRPLWNGVSPSMWDEQEWYDYMAAHNVKDPCGKEAAASLESFFG
jgi:alpha-ketoglutarate-dependent taurine dioxygenase